MRLMNTENVLKSSLTSDQANKKDLLGPVPERERLNASLCDKYVIWASFHLGDSLLLCVVCTRADCRPTQLITVMCRLVMLGVRGDDGSELQYKQKGFLRQLSRANHESPSYCIKAHETGWIIFKSTDNQYVCPSLCKTAKAVGWKFLIRFNQKVFGD